MNSMLNAKIIRPSINSYSSPVILVRKKKGLRLYIDYRAQNNPIIRENAKN